MPLALRSITHEVTEHAALDLLYLANSRDLVDRRRNAGRRGAEAETDTDTDAIGHADAHADGDGHSHAHADCDAAAFRHADSTWGLQRHHH